MQVVDCRYPIIYGGRTNFSPFLKYTHMGPGVVGAPHIVSPVVPLKRVQSWKKMPYINRLVHNLLELISKGYNPTDLSQQPSCNFPGKQIKILFHNLYVD